jgi:hypothetical protein
MVMQYVLLRYELNFKYHVAELKASFQTKACIDSQPSHLKQFRC